MKTTLLLLAAAGLFAGCAREQVADQITADQAQAAAELQANYGKAKAYNDSLVLGHNTSLDAAMMAYYDDRYHHYDAAFTTCHNGLQHTNASADHSHNGQGMVQMHGTGSGMMGGGMMGEGGCQCCTNGGHSAGIHEQMDALRHLHAQHHPQ